MAATLSPTRSQPPQPRAQVDFAERAGDIAEQAGEAVGQLAGQLKVQAERIGTGIQGAAARAQKSFDRAYGSSSQSDFRPAGAGDEAPAPGRPNTADKP